MSYGRTTSPDEKPTTFTAQFRVWTSKSDSNDSEIVSMKTSDDTAAKAARRVALAVAGMLDVDLAAGVVERRATILPSSAPSTLVRLEGIAYSLEGLRVTVR